MGRLRKRAEMSSFIYFLILEIIVFGMFVYAVTTKVNSAAEDTTFVRRVYSRDMALLIDSLHASNGEFRVSYEINKPLDFAITPNRVIFFDHSDVFVNKRPFSAFLFGTNSYVHVTTAWVNDTLSDHFLIASDNMISLSIPPEPNKDKYYYEVQENIDGTITITAKELISR